ASGKENSETLRRPIPQGFQENPRQKGQQEEEIIAPGWNATLPEIHLPASLPGTGRRSATALAGRDARERSRDSRRARTPRISRHLPGVPTNPFSGSLAFAVPGLDSPEDAALCARATRQTTKPRRHGRSLPRRRAG